MSNRMRVAGMNSGLDTDSIVSQLVQKYQVKVDNAVKQQKKLELKQDAWKDLNKEIYSFYSKTLSNMRMSSTYTKMKTTSSNSALTVSAGNSAASGVQSAKIVSTAKAGYITSGKLKSTDTSVSELTGSSLVTSNLGLAAGTYQFNGKDITIDDTTTMSGLASKLSGTGVIANFDEKQQRLYISAKSTGEANDFDLSASATDASLLSALNMGTQYYVDQAGNYYSDEAMTNQITDETTIKSIQNDENAAIRVKGEDAQLMLNGTLYKSDTNAFEINGLTLTINNYTDEDISINTQKDTSGVYNNIKNMFKEYNTIMNKMLKMYNTTNKGYSPLTEEEESAMTEYELEKWNPKLEESALYKDSRISEVMQSIRSVMMAGVKMSDGTNMYLSDFGIATQGYFEAEENERYAYHIDGDPDDEVSSGNTDKLNAMIASDPDKVQEFFSTLSSNLYKKLFKEMGSTSMSSIYKIYNDKEMDKQHSDYDDLIKKYEEQMSKAEDKYYDQFAQMEVALSKINSKSSIFSSYLG